MGDDGRFPGLNDGPASEGTSHAGHRQRLKERFLAAGSSALPDYELLELLLFQALPRRDVKPLAKELLAQFGNFAEVISASPERLRAVKGVGESVLVTLKTVQAAAERLAQIDVLERPVLSSWQKLLAYCQTTMARADKEQFRVLFLNRKNVLIRDEVQQMGTIDHTPLYPREVVKRALEVGATAIIMVHNHPSGDPAPSRADIDMTKDVQEIAAKLGIVLHDHLIISRSGHSSFKEMGLL